MKRSVSTLVLFAFVLVGAAPCGAANMSCGMKMPSADERCASCVTDGGSGPVLKSVSCCQSNPGEDRSTAPAVLTGSIPGSTAPVKILAASLPAASAAVTSAIGLLPQALPCATGPPPSLVLTTVLRL